MPILKILALDVFNSIKKKSPPSVVFVTIHKLDS